jgi:hypothetical protein
MPVSNNRRGSSWVDDGTGKSFADFSGVKVSKWDMASQTSEHAYHLNDALWKFSVDMWSDPEMC